MFSLYFINSIIYYCHKFKNSLLKTSWLCSIKKNSCIITLCISLCGIIFLYRLFSTPTSPLLSLRWRFGGGRSGGRILILHTPSLIWKTFFKTFFYYFSVMVIFLFLIFLKLVLLIIRDIQVGFFGLGFNTGEGGKLISAICSLNQNLVKCLINNFNLAGLFNPVVLCVLNKAFCKSFQSHFIFSGVHSIGTSSLPIASFQFLCPDILSWLLKSRWRAEFWGDRPLLGQNSETFECPKNCGAFSLFYRFFFGGSHYDYIAIRRDDIFPFSHIVFNFCLKNSHLPYHPACSKTGRKVSIWRILFCLVF